MVYFIKKALRAVVLILRDYNEILEDYEEEKVKRLIYKEKNEFQNEELLWAWIAHRKKGCK